MVECRQIVGVEQHSHIADFDQGERLLFQRFVKPAFGNQLLRQFLAERHVFENKDMRFAVALTAAAPAIVGAQIVNEVAKFLVADLHRDMPVTRGSLFPGDDGAVGQRTEIVHFRFDFGEIFVGLKAGDGTVGEALGVDGDAVFGKERLYGAEAISLLSFFGYAAFGRFLRRFLDLFVQFSLADFRQFLGGESAAFQVKVAGDVFVAADQLFAHQLRHVNGVDAVGSLRFDGRGGDRRLF